MYATPPSEQPTMSTQAAVAWTTSTAVDYLRVDLGREDRRAAAGEVADVVDGLLALRRGHRRPQVVVAVEPQLSDAVERRVAAVRAADHPARLEPGDVRHLGRERQVDVGVVV